VKKAGYDRHIDDAFDLYWQTLEPDLDPPEFDEHWYLKFLEWYIHDYPIPEQDRPLIQLFLESGPMLPAEEMQALEDWQDAHLSVYQIKEVEPGEGVLTEDIFNGKEVFINDVSLSHHAKKWQLITTRVVKVLDEWQASSTAILEPPTDKEEIHDFVMGGFRLFRKPERNFELQDFLRASGFVLHQRSLTKQVSPDQSPLIITSSGEELTFCQARYDLAGLDKAVDRLESQEDFAESEWEEDENGQILNISFSWLEKGKSARKAKKIRRQPGIKAETFLSPGPGQETSRVLGNVTLEPSQATLEVQGEQRFALGKERLETVLAGLIQHRHDTVKTLEEMQRDYPPGKTLKDLESEIPPEIREAILKDYLDQHYQKWLDTPLPALNGKTPRTASKTEKGRRRVEDLLRSMEYHHQEKMEYDISWIRKELGM
jgi:hypothetical protein